MPKTDVTQYTMFSYRSLEEPIPGAHPLRKLCILVDAILQSMSVEYKPLYSRRGRPSIALERLLRVTLIQTLFTIRSKRQLVQHIEYNLLNHWFVGLNIDEAAWNHSTFSANRDRLLGESMAQRFFAQVLLIAEWQELISDDYFTVDDTQIEAWVSMKSFVKKDGSLYKKSEGDKCRMSYLSHALMENRNGVVVDAETTLATGTAELDAVLTMAKPSMAKAGSTLGTDNGYDAAGFIKGLRELKITRHVAQKKHSAIDARTTRHKGYEVSLKKRKLVEEIFGWNNTIGGLCKARFVGLAKVRAQTFFTFAANNLTRMATIFGLRLSTV